MSSNAQEHEPAHEPEAQTGTSHENKRPAKNQNVWARCSKDGKTRSHIHPMTSVLFGLRIAQLALAVVFLVLAAFSAFSLNFGSADRYLFLLFLSVAWLWYYTRFSSPRAARFLLAGLDKATLTFRLGLAFFTFSWTVVYFIWLLVSVIAYPIAYHWIAHVILESLTNVFWLATWATFASYAGELNLAGAGVDVNRNLNAAAWSNPTTTTTTVVAPGSLGPTDRPGATSADPLRVTQQTIYAAEICIGVDAGLGAIIWVLFVVTLILTAVGVHLHNKNRRSST